MKFEINQTKIKGGCQLGRKIVTHNSMSDLPLKRKKNILHIYNHLGCAKCFQFGPKSGKFFVNKLLEDSLINLQLINKTLIYCRLKGYNVSRSTIFRRNFALDMYC